MSEKDINRTQFKKGQKVSYFDDMTKKMKVGYVLKKMKDQYLVGEKMDSNIFYIDRAFNTKRGKMTLIEENL
jgi:hypothetical protein